MSLCAVNATLITACSRIKASTLAATHGGSNLVINAIPYHIPFHIKLTQSLTTNKSSGRI